MSLIKRISIVAVLAMLTVAAVLGAVGSLALERERDRLAAAVAEGNDLAWRRALNSFVGRMAAGTGQVQDDFDLRRALSVGDAAEIQTYAERFLMLTGDSGLYQEVALLDGAGTLRYQHGEPSLAAAVARLMPGGARLSEPVQAVVITDDGRMRLLYGFPLTSRDRVVAAAVYAQPIPAVLDAMASETGQAVALMSTDGRSTSATSAPLPGALQSQVQARPRAALLEVSEGARRYSVSQQVIEARGDTPLRLVMARDETAALEALDRFVLIAGAGVTALIVAAVLLVVYLMRRYLAPLAAVAHSATRIAQGDVRVRVERRGVAEIGELESAMDTMIGRLREMVSQIAEVAGRIQRSSGALDTRIGQSHANASALNDGSHQIAMSMEEISATVEQIAASTRSAGEASDQIRREAAQGGESIAANNAGIRNLAQELQSTAATSRELNHSAANVERVLGVIREIAEQTNLLALNAAIEAARAGEAGRGFAVVADEVRKLANRTQESTVEISRIIDSLQDNARSVEGAVSSFGERIAESSGQSQAVCERFEAIARRVDEMVTLNQDIHHAMADHQRTAQQVSGRIEGFSELSSQNLASAEAIRETSASLSELATTLNGLTSRFQYRDA
jgi:methyl-accepting chemotaxis protein